MPSIQESVKNAVETLNTSGETDVSETAETKATAKPESTTGNSFDSTAGAVDKTSSEDTGVIDVPETEEQVQQALNIYRALNNPATADGFIRDLAKTLKEPIVESKATPKEATNAILEVLKDSLGPENEDLALKLAPALEKLINSEVKKPLADINVNQQAEKVRVHVDEVWNKLSKELPDFEKYSTPMTELMTQITPGPKTGVEEYLKNLYRLAGGIIPTKPADKTEVKKEVKKVIQKMNANATESKLNKLSGTVDEERVNKTSHRPSIREAVLSAVQQLNGQGE